MATSSKPLINKDIIIKIWDDLSNSDIIVNDIEQFKSFYKNNFHLFKYKNKHYYNILYLVHCDLLKNHEYLKFGCSVDAPQRISDHLRSTGKQLYKWLKKDPKVDEVLSKYSPDLDQVKKRKAFIKDFCCIQIVEISDDIIKKCIQTHNCISERNIYNEYWGFNNFSCTDIRGRKIGFVEYVEKPLEDIFLKYNFDLFLKYHNDLNKRMIRYTQNVNNLENTPF